MAHTAALGPARLLLGCPGMRPLEQRRGAVELAAKVAFLRTPAAYDAPAQATVDVIETHASWVFLIGERVFKLKKPIRLPYLDFSTLERRHRSCAQEMRLGSRLARDVYLGVEPLVAGPAGLSLGGHGEVVDWLVVMRRLPADRMLPEMLARGRATPADADAVAEVLAAFYQAAARASWDGPEYRRWLREVTVAMTGELIARGAARAPIAQLARDQLAVLQREAPLLDARVAAGRVVDAHGDLRPEHICLETPPAIIDPLEFDDELRMLDRASELAFLALECDRLGASWFGERVIARYEELSKDRIPPPLRALYTRHHAITRALLALRHLDDVPPAQARRWRTKADDYLARARPDEVARAASIAPAGASRSS